MSIKEYKNNKNVSKEMKSEIDGLGVVILIAGICLLVFNKEPNTLNAGLIVGGVGLARIFYVLLKR